MQLMSSEPVAGWPGRTELVKGVITRMAPAHIPHWTAQRLIFTNLYEAMKGVDGGWIVGQEPTVRLAADTVREPDVAILRDAGSVGDVFDRTALFLAVEVADSSLPIDLGAKRLSYAAAFVPHYWVVDINGRRTHLMSDPVRGDYRIRSTLEFGEPLGIPGTERTIVID